MRKRIVVLLCSLLLFCGVLPARAFAARQPSYVALGDSISAGYGLGEGELSFPEKLAEDKGCVLTDLSSNDGVTSADLIETLNTNEAAKAVTSADVITITIGGNDLMNALYEYLADASGTMTADDIRDVLENGTIDQSMLLLLMQQLGGFPASPQASAALGALGANLESALNQIEDLNPNAACVIVNQYNPYGHIDNWMAEAVVSTFDAGVQALNAQLVSISQNHDVTVADVYSAFEASGENPCNASFEGVSDFNLDFHPNAHGHELIAQVVGDAIGEIEPAEYGLSVGGVAVTSANAEDVLGDGTVSYDPSTRTLTLENASIAGTDTGTGSAIESEIGKPLGLVTIEVVGASSCGSIMLHDGCSLAITGSGSLTVSATAPAGTVSVQEDITIDGVTLVATSEEGVIQSNLGDIIVKNGAHIDADELAGEGAYCLAANSIIIEDSTVDVLSEGPNSNLLWVYGDSSDLLSIDNSMVTVTGKPATTPAIWAMNIVIASASEVKVYGGFGNAVYSDGTITVDGSTLHAENTSPDAYPALFAAGDIDVTDGTVTAKSAGMRGIFTEADMTISNNSKVTASGTTDEGMVVFGKLKVENSSLHASTSSDQAMMVALVTEQLEVVASDVTLEGGLDLSTWYDHSTDNASLVIEPSAGELAEFKVDGQNRDGSAAVHFREEGANSPYDARAELTGAQMNWLGAYRYVYIGEHVHAGGAATCSTPAVCDDCGREYGAINPVAHSFTDYTSNNDATCTEDGTESAVCDNGCGLTDARVVQGSALGHEPELVDARSATCEGEGYTGDEVCARCSVLLKRGTAIPATGHDFADGNCIVCGAEDPDYVAPERPDDTAGQSSEQSAGPASGEGASDAAVPATGDVSGLFSLASALVGTSALMAGAFVRRRR